MAVPRSESRDRALGILYEADIKQVAPAEVLSSLAVEPDPFCVALLAAVADQRADLDALIGEVSVGWNVARMPVVDRNVLRLAVAELMSDESIPVAVVIDEAVELAKRYSTDESGPFVNGVLSTIAARLRPGRADPA